ncbi:hypothetical protein [Legionella moravica]|nr:hypothetical protein [Legionella moravica]
MKKIILALIIVSISALGASCSSNCCGTNYNSCCGSDSYGNWY